MNSHGGYVEIGEFIQARIEGWFLHRDFSEDPDQRRRARLMIWVCLLAGPALLLLVAVESLFTREFNRALWVGIGHVVTCSTPVLLRWFRTIKVPARVMTTTATVQLLSASYWTGGVESLVVGVYPLATIFLALVGTIWMCIAASAGLTLGMVAILWLEQAGHLPQTQESEDAVRIAVAAWAIGTGLAFALFNEMLNRAQVRRISEELRHRTIAQREAEHLRDQWESFLTFVSHELRNPLTTISVSLEMLQIDAYEDRRERLIRSMNIASKRLVDLADDVLDFSTMERGYLELNIGRVGLLSMARDFAEEVSLRLGSTQRLLVHGDEGVFALGDRKRLIQVLDNLVGNALKYAPGSDVVIYVEEESNWATITVSDGGPGVPVELEGSLFQAFSRSKGNPAKGHGLGLFICRQLARGMEGDLELVEKSVPGAHFRVRLPLA